jgi:hypothetical protein
MNKRYRYCLSRFGHKDKVVIVSALDSIRAGEMVKDAYPGWVVSQFWVCWPF